MAQSRQINWGPAIVLITYQVLLALTLPFYLYYSFPSLGMVIASVVLLYLTGLSITAGYHRLYSHRAYRAHWLVESMVLFFGAMAGQGSALRWSFDHRIHHAFVDTDRDPYSIKKGFWYAHCLWLLDKPADIDPKVVPDLMKNPRVMFQHRYIGWAMLLTNFIAFVAVGALLGDYLGAFFIALWVRLFALHHFTWFINSLAHTWGDKPFSQEQTAVNNFVISCLTFGEGYHNYHHTFANDYRNGIRWYHFDPTKWLIWTLNRFGLAYDLKKMDHYVIKKKMVLEQRNLLIEQIETYWANAKEELQRQVTEVSDRIVANMNTFSQLKEQYEQLKKNMNSQEALKALHKEIKSLKKALRSDWKQWTLLARDIRYGAPQLSN